MNERVMPLARLHNDIAPFTAIATGGTAAGNKLFPSEREAAVAAIASFDPNFCLIDKHGETVVGRSSLVVRRRPLSWAAVLVVNGTSLDSPAHDRPTTTKTKASSRRRGLLRGALAPR